MKIKFWLLCHGRCDQEYPGTDDLFSEKGRVTRTSNFGRQEYELRQAEEAVAAVYFLKGVAREYEDTTS